MAWISVCLGTVLNPLNSSMIAIALVPLRDDLGLSTLTVSWVVTVFYIVSVVGQPLMGRIIDVVGARSTFIAGMALVVVGGAFGMSGGFILVCVARGLLAFGSSVAFPASVALAAPVAERSGRSGVSLLGQVQMANTAAAAIGPVLGGVLLATVGWHGLFLVNIPIAALSIVGALRFLPPSMREKASSVSRKTRPRAFSLQMIDLPGAVTFTVASTALVLAAVGMSDVVSWIALVVGLVLAAAFVMREMHAEHPFIDLRLIVGNRRLALIYLAFGLFSALFYIAFFGLPQFLENRGGYSPAIAGVLLLPLAAATVLFAPFAVRLIERRGSAVVLRVGAAVLVGSVVLLGIGALTTAWPWMLVVSAAIGIPYCLVALGATHALHESAPTTQLGSASGVLQATRYVGAIAATVVLGATFTARIDAAEWLTVVAVAGVLAVLHLGAIVARGRGDTNLPSSSTAS